MSEVESIVAQLAVVLLLGVILYGIADTPLYGIALGIEIVALFFVLTTNNTAQKLVSSIGAFVGSQH